MANDIATNNDAHVDVCDVVIRYPGAGKRSEVLAVDTVSVSIRRGEKLVILGPSGCGKSTLLMAMGGFIGISSGTILVNGNKVRKPTMERIMVFQDFMQLLPWKTVLENVAWGIRKRWPRLASDDVKLRAQRQIELVGLTSQSEQYPNTLSGGQKQRCAIARSFAVAPEILLMDEPFGALDAINREKMQAELNNIWDGQEQPITVAFVTHDVNEALYLGHRIMVMTDGPGRVRALLANKWMGKQHDHPDAIRFADELRQLLKTQKVEP